MDNLKVIAHIYNDFKDKFGIPRQSGLAQTRGVIEFEKAFRDPSAVRGLEGFSHIWILWEFSEAKRETWSPTVRPPRLGGETRMGVFATRSPFRPNSLALSCVKLVSAQILHYLNRKLRTLLSRLTFTSHQLRQLIQTNITKRNCRITIF